MTTIGQKNLSLQEKWEKAKDYYENIYRHPITKKNIQFKKIPEPHQILMLYDSMRKLAESEQRHLYQKKRQQEYQLCQRP